MFVVFVVVNCGCGLAYLADDVNKVFAKVSKKISKVKMERLLTIKS